MALELVGQVHEVGDVQQVTDKFRKRDLVVKVTDGEFEEFIAFEAHQDRVELFDTVNVGDTVEVSFNLRGRPWTSREGVTKYFNTLVAWRVNPLNQQDKSGGKSPSKGGDDDFLF